jgi:hypothetical protein
MDRFTVKITHRRPDDITTGRGGVSLAEVVLENGRVFATYRSDLALDPDFYIKAARLSAARLNERLAREGQWWADHKDTVETFWDRMELLGHTR